MQRVVQSLGIVLLVCLGVRVAAWLVAPVLPFLGFIVIVLIVSYVVIGPWLRSGIRR